MRPPAEVFSLLVADWQGWQLGWREAKNKKWLLAKRRW